MQFLLSGLLLHTQPLHSSEQHTRAHLEFSSHFAEIMGVVSDLSRLITTANLSVLGGKS